MKLYNTLNRQKECFQPITEGKVGIYVCGITAYDNCHIGHARSALVFDMVTRYLRWCGFEVRFVKNFTDVDDKIINKANREGTTIFAISQRYIAEHNHDMNSLGVLPPNETPLATEHIDGMIALIESLIAKGIAYAVDGDVYFSVEKFPGYGKLSGRNPEELLAGARVEVGEKKHNPLDFALWKASKENEPWWESPWGRGRPGWHIECSAMGKCLLGECFDIHGGGADLIFPHHENEIAQSEAAYGKMPARYWMHNGFVKISGEKMSKSLDNFITIKDLLKVYHPDVLRFFMLQFHYRSPIDFSLEALAEARSALNRCYRLLEAIDSFLVGRTSLATDTPPLQNEELRSVVASFPEKFREAMDDDFNSAKAFGVIFDFVRLVNSAIANKNFGKSTDAAAILSAARKNLTSVGEALGLFTYSPAEYFQEDTAREIAKLGVSQEEIGHLVNQRQKAREEKNWARADEIRETLAGMKIQIKDTARGTAWFVE
ncbi:MAG: cysteine--tRNA ligase [Deltaproteobacteria bacterium]|nr:cysteine--tRNA ligase [Deltaproteobacteria bacterium]